MLRRVGLVFFLALTVLGVRQSRAATIDEMLRVSRSKQSLANSRKLLANP